MNVRRIEERDRARIEEFISRDPDHIARAMTADFFFEHASSPVLVSRPGWVQVGALALCFEDSVGVVFYVRLDIETISGPAGTEQSVRIHIQFDSAQPLRTARVLDQGFEVVRDRCRVAGAPRLVFDSIDGRLRDFCMKRFGFQPVPGTADLDLWL